MNTINLSPKQSQIVNLGAGSYLIEASAGSGKTRVLTERVKKLLEDNSSKILAITFTNKAVGEMKSRVVDTLSEFAQVNPNTKAQEVMAQIQAETRHLARAVAAHRAHPDRRQPRAR